MNALDQPAVRLALRALLAGGIAFGVALQAAPNLDRAAVMAAGSAALMAAVEVFTPVNRLVGPFKAGEPVVKQKPLVVDVNALRAQIDALREASQLVEQSKAVLDAPGPPPVSP